MLRRKEKNNVVDGIFTVNLSQQILPANNVLQVVMRLKDNPLFNLTFGLDNISISTGRNIISMRNVIDTGFPTMKLRINNEEVRMDKKKMLKADYIFHSITKDNHFVRIDISVYVGCNTYSSKFDDKLLDACHELCKGYIEAYDLNEHLIYPLVIPEEAINLRHKRNYSGVVAVFNTESIDDDVLDLDKIQELEDPDKDYPELNLDLAVKNRDLVVDVIRKSKRNYSIR